MSRSIPPVTIPTSSQQMIALDPSDLDQLTRLIITNHRLPTILRDSEILCLVHIMRLQWTYKRRDIHTTEIVVVMRRNWSSVCRYINHIKTKGLLTEEGGMKDGHRTYELAQLFEYLSKPEEAEEAEGRYE